MKILFIGQIPRVLFWCLIISTPCFVYSQNLTIPIDSRSTIIMDRWIIQGYNDDVHPEIKAFQRKNLENVAVGTENQPEKSATEKYDLKYIKTENQDFSGCDSCLRLLKNKKPILKYFYDTPADLIAFKSDDFYLKINPVIGISLGNEKTNDNNIFENHRGIEIRGGVDDKIYFYSQILESQQSYVTYLTERINRFQAIPGNGFYKDYTSKIFNVKDGFDFNNANAYVGFNITKHIGAQFGYGKNFIGNGIRSLLLSDYSNNYLYLKFNTRIGRFHYQNIFGELQAAGARDDVGDVLIPKKYFAAHYLSFAINKNWHAGFFETVVFSRRNQFEFQYLNPVILYRTVEGALGSPDNVLIGFNVSGNLFKKVQLYGQLLLDEFLFKELITNNRGWWANKYGLQGGIKYINAMGIKDLDLQFESNMVMPYTYSHTDTLANFSHYNQPLAHPLGANFIEGIAIFRYRIIPQLTAQCWIHVYKQGLNSKTENWGEDVLQSNTSRVQDYNNKLLQGQRVDVSRITLRLDWEFYHNMSVFGEYTQRKQQDTSVNNLRYFGAGVRINLAWKPLLL